MMFSGQLIPSKLKWKWRGDSSLSTSLLQDVPPEVELSQYGRIPSPISESPSQLLNGESSLNLYPILDLDLFFGQLYNYYLEKGLWCIITSWVVELLGLGFIICFSGFFLLFVDWDGVRNTKCGIDAVDSGTKPCDLAKQALHQHPLSPLTMTRAIIVGYLGIFSIYWVFCFLRFFAQLKDILRIRHFYYNSLHVTDTDLQTMPWPTILEKIVKLQSSHKLCVIKDLSAHDIMMRLMRNENFFIAMVNKGVLAFDIPSWFPGAGPAVIGSNGRRKRLILTKTLQWTLNWCVLQSMFDRNFCIQSDFISSPEALRKRCKLIALAGYILSPFLVIFVLVYFFLRHAEQLYNHPRTASSRNWSNLSKWILREFNEADHLFQHRLNSSIPHASNYIKQFPSPIISIIAKFISFVSGGFAAILIMIAFVDESLLEGHIFGRNLLWYMAVFGTISAASRTAIADVLLVLDPKGAMSKVVQHSHYMPKKWRGREHTQDVHMEFGTLFQYTVKMLFEEITSIFLTPYLLFSVVSKRVDDILQFISDYTVHVEGVGDVCSFSVFDFQKHGNSNYASPCHADQNQRSSQGKMEKSFLSFQSSYPSWEPEDQGKQFLSNLRTFREEMLRAQATNCDTYSPPQLWNGDACVRNRWDQTTFDSRQPQQDVLETGTHLGSVWLVDINQWNHPYLLDWYYTSRPRNANTVTTAPSIPTEATQQQQQQQLRDLWVPPDFMQNKVKFEGLWGRDSDNLGDRSQSHMGASTAAPLFRESIFQTQGRYSGHNHWWARDRVGATNQVETSFIEPPDFSRNPVGWSSNYFDSYSEPSAEWSHQQLTNPGLSRTMEDKESGDVGLHFDDVYNNKTPESPRID